MCVICANAISTQVDYRWLHTLSFILIEVCMYLHVLRTDYTQLAGKGIVTVALWLLPALVTATLRIAEGSSGHPATLAVPWSLSQRDQIASSLPPFYTRPLKFWSHACPLL